MVYGGLTSGGADMVMGFKGAVWRSRWRLILIEYWFDSVGLRGYRVDAL